MYANVTCEQQTRLLGLGSTWTTFGDILRSISQFELGNDVLVGGVHPGNSAGSDSVFISASDGSPGRNHVVQDVGVKDNDVSRLISVVVDVVSESHTSNMNGQRSISHRTLSIRSGKIPSPPTNSPEQKRRQISSLGSRCRDV